MFAHYLQHPSHWGVDVVVGGERITPHGCYAVACGEITVFSIFTLKGGKVLFFILCHYNTTLAVAPLLRRAIYTPAGSVATSMVAVVAPWRTACVATARPVASYSVIASPA